jgi:hypothetical protein
MKKKLQLEDHLGRSGKLIEKDAIDAPVKDIEWKAQEMEAPVSDPLADDGSGKEVILRRFQFQFPPNLPTKPTKKEILAFHKDKLNIFLWKDELELIQTPKVRVHKTGYDIFATCIAKKGSLIFEKPKLLQHAITQQPGSRD